MNTIKCILLFCLVTVISACAEHPSVDMRVHTNNQKNIFVFIDGTQNDERTGTNVRRLYEVLSEKGTRRSVTLYIKGVGDDRYPVTGAILGRGMDYRITEAYAQLAKLYSAEARKCEDDKGSCPDRIYIFGFSRGALIARALAGLVSYAGLPKVDGSARSPEDYRRLATAINDYTKGIDDAAVTNFWKTWRPGSAPPLAKDIGRMKIDRKVFKEIKLEPVQIQFVGLWDTVPGTFIKNFGVCIEESDKKSGTRYKTNTYPTIGHIAHAVSQDEKRGRFELLHICEPLQPEHTTAHEVVFPGAHSDIGGGYADLPKDNCAINKCVTALPNISMVWMLDELIAAEEKLEKKKDPRIIDLRREFSVHADAAGVAHWSLAGFKNKATNFCRDREWDWEKRHAGANADLPRGVRWELHKAIKDRGEKALIKYGDEVGVEPKLLPYPPTCSVFK